MSDHIGHPNTNQFEHLLARPKWDADLLRDEIRTYVVEHLGPDAALIADDTTAINKGTKSVGAARQYCGLTGQVETAR